MTFLNYTILFGLTAVAAPIIIHLLKRRQAKVVYWGAMRFLLASLASRNRRILIEEVLLLAIRCLAVALVVLAMARPFLPTRAAAPWVIVVPATLLAAILGGVAAAMWARRGVRWLLLGAAAALLAAAGSVTAMEHFSQSSRWAAGGEKDVAIIIDGSMSMSVVQGGKTNFQRAIDEARGVVGSLRPADGAAVILAGPVPRLLTGGCITDRKQLLEALSQAAPSGGAMRVLEAMNVAAGALAEGQNPGKKFVLITDGQNVGWDLPGQASAAGRRDAQRSSPRNEERWRFLAAGFQHMPTPPQVIVRTLGLPAELSNAAVSDVTFSRGVIGPDRPVRIDVKIANTGTGPITPASVELVVDGEPIPSQKVGQISPNAAETVSFTHRFDRSGPHVVVARIDCPDDLKADNEATRVVNVIEKLPVLIVDGAPSSRPLESAASFLALALAPRDEDRARRSVPPPAGDEDEPQFLVQPKVVYAPDIASVKSFGDYAAVILAGVPRLPRDKAEGLARYVQAGGGLLILPNDGAEAAFYNAWSCPSGELLMPALLGQQKDSSAAPIRLAMKTFTHPALEMIADSARSDGESALVRSYWQLAADQKDTAVRVGALLDSGEPFLVDRKLGKGYVAILGVSLDGRDSNLPTLKCFVPLVHELVYFLAGQMAGDTNVAPGAEVIFDLPAVAVSPTTAPAASAASASASSGSPPAGTAARAVAVSGVQGALEQGYTAEVVTPSNRRHSAAVVSVAGALRLSFGGTDEPGLYRLMLVPPSGGKAPAALADGLPFVVLGDPAESVLTPLSDSDLDSLRRHVKVLKAETPDELTASLTGSVPGEELWKFFAIAAAMALVAEVAMTRWIAVQRRTHKIQEVAFGSQAADVEAFRTKARDALNAGRQTEAAPKP